MEQDDSAQPAELDEQARAARITEVAGSITQLLGLALQHSGLELRDVLLCAALATNGLGRLALSLQAPDGTLTEEEVRQMTEHAMTAGMKAEVFAMKFNSKAEMDQFMQGGGTGLH